MHSNGKYLLPKKITHAHAHAHLTAHLQDNGAATEVRTVNWQVPLMIAAIAGKTEAVNLLLNKGADIKARSRDTKGNPSLTILMHAVLGTVMGGSTTVATVAALVDRGADLEARDSEGYTALMHAAMNVEDELVRLLVRKGVSAKSSWLTATLCWSACARQTVVTPATLRLPCCTFIACVPKNWPRS